MTEIGRGERAGFSGSRLMLVHADAKNGFTQPARTAVNEHQEHFCSQPEAVEFPGDENFLDRLQFGDMVATAEHAERGVEGRRVQVCIGELRGRDALPGVFLWLQSGAQTACADQRLRTMSLTGPSRRSGARGQTRTIAVCDL